MRSLNILSISIAASVLLVVFSFGSIVGWVCAQTTEEAKPALAERPIGEIRKDVAAFIKRSKSKESSLKAAAVFDLCLLHREIVNDPRFETDNNLTNFRAMVASRLKKCKSEIELAQKRALRAQAKRDANTDQQDFGDETLVDDAGEKMTDDVFVATTMSNHLHMVGQISGGPSQIMHYANGNFGGGHVNDLINLIESTIDPSSWRSAGGNGQMFFYRPVLALVVTGSADVQDRVGDLLRTLRRNQ